MKIVCIVSRVPFPLEKGDKLRAYHQLKILNKFHDVYLIALNKGALHPKSEFELKKICKELHIIELTNIQIFTNLIIALFKGLPLQVGYFYSHTNRKKIHKLISEIKPDHIYGQLIRTAEYIKNFSKQKTIDYQDAFSAGMERRANESSGLHRIFFKLENKRLLKYEENIFKHFDNHTIISLADRELLKFEKSNTITIVPNGIDFEHFTSKITKQNYDVVFTGNMNYAPNIKAAKFLINEIMPLVWAKKPNCSVLISGANPSKSITKLATEKVTVSGWVDDIRDSYANAKIFIAPMQIGTGLQNKLIEAMAMELPCITSELANRALHAKDEQEILIAEKANEYAHHIFQLLEDEEHRKFIGKNGNEFIKKNFSWEKSTNILMKLIESKN